MKPHITKPLNEKPNAETLPILGNAGITLNGNYLPPPEDKDGKIWVRTSALIQRTPVELYEIWHDLQAVSQWQEQINSVTAIDGTHSHWVMQSGDKTIEWDSEVLKDEPGKRIAWRSTGGESDNAGEVIFEGAPGESKATMVTILQEFRMGKVASAWEAFVSRNPKQLVIENLRHFKAFAETGEIPRTQGQPHGSRGVVAGMKQLVYGEKIATPPAANLKAS